MINAVNDAPHYHAMHFLQRKQSAALLPLLAGLIPLAMPLLTLNFSPRQKRPALVLVL